MKILANYRLEKEVCKENILGVDRKGFLKIVLSRSDHAKKTLKRR